MATERTGDLILAQGTYVLVQDGSTGQVDVIVGPNKTSLADTDKPVIYDNENREFSKVVTATDAVKTFPTANEGQYMVLHNPAKKEDKEHPTKGKQQTVELGIGNKVNIPGPVFFALYPGQHAEVIGGHQLKSNEYLVVKVYNEESAKQNFDKAIVKNAEGEKAKSGVIKKEDLINGRLFIIRGINVSFYIPPTGIEVVKDENDNYVRNAVTLERLEYTILLDQNGDKRYVKGPDVVFPNPTEEFITNEGKSKFKAIELNENMGIYIKVIADYTEGEGKESKQYKAGDEIFITGNELKIYYPRPEHALIKYGEQFINFAVAIPEGEGRYVLNKVTGAVEMVTGPKMFLPDPRKQVIVRRVLDERSISLFYPGNSEAIEFNKNLEGLLGETEFDEASRGLLNSRYLSTSQLSGSLKKSISFDSLNLAGFGDDVTRSKSYTKPRTVTLNTKYEGVVTTNIWPGYALQLVKKNGEREVVIGPKTILLGYDETLEILALSTGKPKTDQKLVKTVYLQVENNIVSDIIEVETKDSVNASIRLSYRVNFKKEDSAKWFNVSNYVKLLTQHLRSVVRNSVKKNTIEEFNNNATDIIRNIILGDPDKGKRVGKYFEENGMHVYDVEVLGMTIGDERIAGLLKASQYDTVEKNLEIAKKSKFLEFVKKSEDISRQEMTEKSLTDELRYTNLLKQISSEAKAELEKIQNVEAQQDILNKISVEELNRQKSIKELLLEVLSKEADIEIKKVREKMGSITPGLIEAITSLGSISLSEILAKNIKAQTSGLHGIFPQGGIEGIFETIKGTTLEKDIKSILVPTNGKTKI